MSNVTDEEKHQLRAFWEQAIAKFCPHPLMRSEVDKGVLSELALRLVKLEAEHAALNERHQALGDLYVDLQSKVNGTPQYTLRVEGYQPQHGVNIDGWSPPKPPPRHL